MAKRLLLAFLLLASTISAWAAQGKVLIMVQNPRIHEIGEP